MDQDLIAFLEARFRETSQQLDDRFQQVDARFEQVHDEIRHTRIEVEGLRSDLRLLAEGMLGIGERLDTFQGEVKQNIEETRTFTRLSYADLERRVRPLEAWKERKERDPVEIIRERLRDGTI
jgi:uncharacterized protein YllA (UPF0747 family)